MAEAAKVQAAAEPARMVPQITLDRMKQAEQARIRYEVILPSGIEPDDILPVQYWSHLASTFQSARTVGNVELVVMTEDLRWEAELRVVDAGANWARVVFKTSEDGKRLITKLGGLQSAKVVFLPGHTVSYSGVFAKWRVVRDADGAVLRDKCNSEGDAYVWLADYAKSIQR